MRRPCVVEAWGSTQADRAATYPCDRLIDHPDGVVFRAVEIAAPPGLVFRWLCQLRVAPYSYDWIDNLGQRSPQRLIDGLDKLEVGQRVMTMFRLAAFEPDRSITIDSKTAAFGRVAGTYLIVPVELARSRLVVKLAYIAPSGLYGALLRGILPAGDLIMMRKQLLTLKALIERQAATEIARTDGG